MPEGEAAVVVEVHPALEAGAEDVRDQESEWEVITDPATFEAVKKAIDQKGWKYLEAGGLGFMLGDGRLNAGQERLAETYYAVSLGRFLTATLDAQRIWNPGYNRDRGPVDIYALRLHAQF